MKKRDFIKLSSLSAMGLFLAPSLIMCKARAEEKLSGLGVKKRLRTAHIGVGNMGLQDLTAISSHTLVDVVALCDVDANFLAAAKELYPNAKFYADYRKMYEEIGNAKNH